MTFFAQVNLESRGKKFRYQVIEGVCVCASDLRKSYPFHVPANCFVPFCSRVLMESMGKMLWVSVDE
jgi:hypothetical protein